MSFCGPVVKFKMDSGLSDILKHSLEEVEKIFLVRNARKM